MNTTRVDLVGNRNWLFAFSFGTAVIALVLLAIPPALKPGIEFSSGTTTLFKFQAGVDANAVRDVYRELGHPEARIQTKRMKWDTAYRKRHGVKTVYARRMSKVAEERLEHVCRTAFRALWLRDYARIDVRLAKDDEIWFL